MNEGVFHGRVRTEIAYRAAFEGVRRVERDQPGAIEHRHPVAIFRSEEHTSELESIMRIAYAVFCLKKHTKENTVTKISTHRIAGSRSKLFRETVKTYNI